MSNMKIYIGSINFPNVSISGETDGLYSSNSILPKDTLQYSLGSTGQRWKDMYVGPGTINILGPPGSLNDATLGSDTNGIAYTQHGFASPFINIGPIVGVPDSVGGWQLGPTGSTGTPQFDLIATENTSSGLIGPSFSLIKNPITKFVSNVLYVNQANGNDIQGGYYPYSYPFKTITAALSASSSNNCIYVYPGYYQESITIPTGRAIRGISLQTVSIGNTGAIGSTGVITMGVNTRVEDMTITLSGATTAGSNLVGVHFPTGTSKTAKLRTAVVNVTNTTGGTIGVLSDGIDGSTGISSSNAIRACSVNTNTSINNQINYGILCQNSNRMTIRDTNVFSTGGTGTVGCHSENGGFLDLRTSTISGSTYDISRNPTGTLLLGFTDLVNSTSNGNGFLTSVDSNSLSYGLIYSNNTSGICYLLPGTSDKNSVPSLPVGIPFVQNSIVINCIMKVINPITTGSIIINIYKNNIINIPIFSGTLDSSNQKVSIINKSETFTSIDEIIIQVNFGITNIQPANQLIVIVGQY